MRVTIETNPSRILNLAYLLGSGEDQPHFAMKLNILGMDNCFEAARLCGVKRVVYASSVAVSGLQKHFGDRLANEDDATYGTSQYAMHKIFNEFQAQQYIKNYGMSITGVRPANVTGPDKVRGSVDHVRLITLPAQGKPVHLPWKAMMRLPIHVEDIAEVFVRVGEKDDELSEILDDRLVVIQQILELVLLFVGIFLFLQPGQFDIIL